MQDRKLKNSGIYTITNTTNGKQYIGASSDVYVRKSNHYSELRRGTHHNKHLQRSFYKYGEENFKFVVLQRGIPNKDLYRCEKNFIIAFDSLNSGYNKCLPNENGSPGFTQETKEKISMSVFFHHNPQATDRDYWEWIEMKNTPGRSRQEAGKGRRKPIHAICQKTNEVKHIFKSSKECLDLLGRASQRAINKEGRFSKGLALVDSSSYCPNKDYRKKHIEPPVVKGVFKGNPLEAECVTTGEVTIYSYMNKAIGQKGFTKSGISRVLYGDRKTHKGHRFKLLKVEER